MAHPDHDQVIGRLVGARLRGPAERRPGGAGAAEPHPDAETWAAYVDGGLLPDEVRTLEAHLAGCAVCRGLVVALAPEVSSAAAPAMRSAEPASVPARVIPFPRRQVFAWMGIAAGLFAAVTLWSVSRLGRHTVAMSVAVATPPPADAPASAGPAPPSGGAAAPRATAPAELDRLKADAELARRPAAAVSAPPAPSAEDKRAAAPAVATAAPAVAVDNTRQIQFQTNTVAAGAARARGPLATQANTQQQNVAGSVMPPPAAATQIAEALPVPAPPPAAASSPAAPVRADAAAPAPVQAEAAGGARERRANEAQVGQLADVVVTTGAPGARPEAATPARSQAGADRSRAAASKDEAAKTLGFGGAAPAALPSFAEPDGRLRWRIAEGRRLESSSDGGAMWAARYTAPRGERLRAGTSPSIDSAWAVGDRGFVVRNAVPGGWAPVSRPAAVTLIAVSATGAQSARVTAADGRVFETADGGATWTTIAGPQ